MDMRLLEHYLSLGRDPWSLSPEAAYLDCLLRRWIRDAWPDGALRVVNIGIGAGAWTRSSVALPRRTAGLSSVRRPSNRGDLFTAGHRCRGRSAVRLDGDDVPLLGCSCQAGRAARRARAVQGGRPVHDRGAKERQGCERSGGAVSRAPPPVGRSGSLPAARGPQLAMHVIMMRRTEPSYVERSRVAVVMPLDLRVVPQRSHGPWTSQPARTAIATAGRETSRSGHRSAWRVRYRMLLFDTPPSHRGLFAPRSFPVAFACAAQHFAEQYLPGSPVPVCLSAMKSAPPRRFAGTLGRWRSRNLRDWFAPIAAGRSSPRSHQVDQYPLRMRCRPRRLPHGQWPGLGRFWAGFRLGGTEPPISCAFNS
jgi:hypothetical protein